MHSCNRRGLLLDQTSREPADLDESHWAILFQSNLSNNVEQLRMSLGPTVNLIVLESRLENFGLRHTMVLEECRNLDNEIIRYDRPCNKLTEISIVIVGLAMINI